ncbi:MAG: HD family phosphohydrolase [Elusimicrobiota bacterium]
MPIMNLRKIKITGKSKYAVILTGLMAAFILAVSMFYYGHAPETILGIVLLITGIFGAGAIMYLISYPKIFKNSKHLILTQVILLLFLAILIPIKNTSTLHLYLMPTAGAGVLLTLLINPVVALINVTILSLIVSFLGDFNFGMFFITFVSGLVGVYGSINVRTRRDLNRCGLYIFAANIVTISAVNLLNSISYAELAINLSWGAGNALITVIIASGFLPIFESIFGITTDIKLLELGDFNNPLLKRLMLEAPGTYHHSLMVANLAENACENIGANPLLGRVGAYYHDIGKLKNPHYFSENTPANQDRHKNLKPNISALILKRHVKDGVALADEYNLDEIIKKFIEQHHGTTLIEYFYNKVLALVKDETEIDKKEYRYPGPRPSTKEIGVVMLADSVEAACRSLDDPSFSRISGQVVKIINNKFIDGQLNNCNITLSNLEKIQECFTKTLSGIHHSRIEYPEDKEETKIE